MLNFLELNKNLLAFSCCTILLRVEGKKRIYFYQINLNSCAMDPSDSIDFVERLVISLCFNIFSAIFQLGMTSIRCLQKRKDRGRSKIK